MRDQMLQHLPALRRYAHALTGDCADAEDLLQDCIARAMAQEGRWRGINLKAWLFTIMTNLFRNGMRSRRRAAPLFPLEAAGDVAAPFAEPDPLEQNRLVAALATLAPEMRAVLLLVVLEECSYAETAGILDIPQGTVMSRLSRARRQLARVLAQDNIVPLKRR